jgi:protoporphyrinogen oxidase
MVRDSNSEEWVIGVNGMEYCFDKVLITTPPKAAVAFLPDTPAATQRALLQQTATPPINDSYLYPVSDYNTLSMIRIAKPMPLHPILNPHWQILRNLLKKTQSCGRASCGCLGVI